MMPAYDMLIVGAGLAGQRAALAKEIRPVAWDYDRDGIWAATVSSRSTRSRS